MTGIIQYNKAIMEILGKLTAHTTILAPYLKIIHSILVVTLVYLGARLGIKIILPLLERTIHKKSGVHSKQTMMIIQMLVQICVWTITLTILLDNLGIRVSALITGLGIGGIAIALAAQSILGDLFSYFIIFFDRPFELGDYIVVGEFKGTVENIGVKTTRLRSLDGEELVFSNTDLTGSRVRNYKRMNLRRIVFQLHIPHQTPLAQLKLIPQILAEIINSIQQTRLDRVHFAKYGESSLVYEIVYYVLSSDYNRYMDIQQEINFRIREEFEQKDIRLAYPTRTLFIKKEE